MEDTRSKEASPGDVRSALARALSDPIPAKILVVDDEPRNLFATEEVLRAHGLEIVTADSGEAALRHVLQQDFAVILLDVQMPRLDGYEVAGLIRSRPRSARVPILFLTAHNKDDAHVFRGYSAGAVDYVFKPIEPLILKSKVDVFVDLYRKTEEIRRQGEEERRLLTENLRVRGEKLKVEQALRRREEHQSLVLASLPIALYTASGQEHRRQLHFTSGSIERITGFPPEAFLEQPEFWASRLNLEDRERVLFQLRRLPEDGTVSLGYRWRCADGVERHFLDQTLLMCGDDGQPGECFGMWFDITERKQMEQNLLHASKLEALGRLTGGIAHDFNNMLSAASGDEAARLLQANGQVDLVFSDIRMPGELTGIGLARLIRREWPEMRVLLTTGYVDGEEPIEDIDVLYKPYRAVDLAKKIQALTATPRSGDGEAIDVHEAASAAE